MNTHHQHAKIKFHPSLWASIMLVFLFTGCTTTKKKDDVKGLGMLYQNMTAHYNGYFNATEIMKESEVTLTVEHQDNYNQILPVFEHTAVDDPKSVASNLDEAIKKASVVISMHRPSKWTDDCYLLIGQAQYLKQDYESAQKTLEYMINNFDETGKSTSKSKKKPSKAQSKAERQKQMQERSKEIAARKKNQAQDRKERNKEIQATKKTQVKKRNSEKKDREKANKERIKKRNQANKARAKARKKKKKGKKSSSSSRSKSDAQKKTDATKKSEPLTPTKTDTKPKKEVKEFDDPIKEEKEKKEKELTDKQKEKQDKIKDGALAHAPAYPFGVLWLAKTYVERDFLTQADRLFKQVMANENADKKLMEDVYPSVAHFYIYNGQYNDAIPALEKAIESTNKKSLQARYSYIIGQLKMMTGSKSEAVPYFDQAASWSRDYEMEFNAKMSSKLASMSTGSKSKDEIAKELEKMTKDDKNAEYLDQIYFQIAKVYLEADDIAKAEEYLKLALENIQSNSAQKIEIHYALGDIYFSKDQFDKAFDNYSLALSSMNKTDSRYRGTEERIADLTTIATQLKELNLQDSLIMLAGLSDEELKERAAQILKVENEKMAVAEEKMRAATAKNVPTSLSSPTQTANSTNIKTNFFAYNEKDLKKGIREFDKTWGSRPLVDDWRRNESGEAASDDEDTDVGISFEKEPTSKEVEDIFRDLPRSEEAKAAAHTKIAEALYTLGMEYRNKLERLDLSSEAFSRFVDEFPTEPRLPEVYYFLYLNARDQQDMTKAAFYAAKLKDNYPDTKFALIAADPNYINELLSDKNTAQALYDETYQAFQNGEYQKTYDAFEQAKAKFGNGDIHMSKFALLQAMSVGKIKGKEEYVEALRTVVAQFPNTPEQVRAREIIRFLGGDEEAFGKTAPPQFSITKFKSEFDKLHYVIVALYNEEVVNVNDAKISINDYNNLFHKLDRLTVRSFIINRDKKTNAVLVRKFDNKVDAMKYHDEVQGRIKEFVPEGADVEIFAVSQFNYREMIKSGSPDSYLQYFRENYLRQ